MLALAILGCEKAPIAWTDPITIAQSAGATRLVVDSNGQAKFTTDSLHDPDATTPQSNGLCRTSLVHAAGITRLFAAWWSVRRDSSAILYAAASPDAGKTWAAPIVVDTSDVSSFGCTRPAPSVTTVGDDVYVAYSMIAPEGKGVFFAHTMGMMLHSPVPVIYGERLVSTAIAADGDRVLVGYEEPNGTRPQIDLAYSVTQGHIFEVHTVASRSVDDGALP
ncbi:MAG TPA: hypothetical protein VGM50_20595, partial [Gemmatimonadaceae bacterium]